MNEAKTCAIFRDMLRSRGYYDDNDIVVEEQKSDNARIPDEKLFPAETLYVSTDGQGSHTYSYVSTFEFVPNSNVSVLIPRRKMSLQEKLYYAQCITNNRYKFSYGRKPKGDRLKSVLIPEYPPQYVTSYTIDKVVDSFSGVLNNL